MSARIGTPLSSGGGTARAYFVGSSTSAPGSETGANGDVFTSTTHPYPVFQKQGGSWVDVSWSQDSVFSMGTATYEPAQKQYFLDAEHLPSDWDILTLTTMSGSVTVHFYAEGGSAYGGATFSTAIQAGMAGNIASALMGYSATLTVTNQGETLVITSLEQGVDAFVTWSCTGSGVFGAGTVNGSATPGAAVNGPFTIKAAVAGSRHVIRSATIGAAGEGTITDYLVFSGTAGGNIMAGGPSNANVNALLTPTAIGIVGVEGAALIVRQESNLAEGESRTLTVNGFTLQD